MNMRKPSDDEIALVKRFAQNLNSAEREQLLLDISCATVTSAVPDGSRIIFEIAGYDRPVYRGQHTFGVEARMLDEDAAELSVLLHADENGRLLELEIIRWDSIDVISPRWDTLKVL
jgi:hypothetical protein